MLSPNGFFGLSFGLALFLKALETGQVAKVSMLVAISPVLMLPFIWFQTKKVPAMRCLARCNFGSSKLLDNNSIKNACIR
jgi:drug/metabolite transporter (DMT)-like permease